MKKIIIVVCFIMMIGIGNGMFSWVHSCSNQYLNLRVPANYIFFPHTIGYYIGRMITFDFKIDKFSYCHTIFNQTLEGPKNEDETN